MLHAKFIGPTLFIVLCAWPGQNPVNAQRSEIHRNRGEDGKHHVILPLRKLSGLHREHGGNLIPVKIDQRLLDEADRLLWDSALAWHYWSTEWDTVPYSQEERDNYADEKRRNRGESFWHFRQYAGAKNTAGDLLICVNAFCYADRHDHWRHKEVYMIDGGDCYWQAVINLTTKRVEVFEVNGDA